MLALYAQKGQNFVEPDLAQIQVLGTSPVTGSLLADAHLARHDPDKLARCILQTVAEEIDWPGLRPIEGRAVRRRAGRMQDAGFKYL